MQYIIINWILNNLISIIGTGFLTSIITLKYARRKSAAQTKSIELNNTDKVIKMYTDINKVLEKRVEVLECKVDELYKISCIREICNDRILK